MASEHEASCDADPNFAVVCAFFEKFGAACGLQAVDFVELQQMLENTQEVSPVLIDLHVKLMRKIKKSITPDRWERAIVKICHTYSNQDAWEIERFGYKKARLSAKLRLLKELLEMQFDNNTSFKNKINVITAKELRSHPIGRDKLGNAYWYQIDDSCQVRVYKEDPDEETWALVAKDRDGLVTLISKLNDNQDSSSTDAVTNEDSNSNNEETKTVLDTGQQDSNSSKKSSDDDKPPELTQEVDDDDDTKMEGKEIPAKMPELTPPLEERRPELTGVKEKYIRSDNFVQSNRKAVASAGFVDIGDLKRPIDDDVDLEPGLVKRPRTTARPTLLGNKKKPYLQEEEEEDEELDEEELEEEEDFDDDDEDDDDDDEIGPAIEEPLMLVTGKGSGKDSNCANAIVGDVIEEDVMFFRGEGSGRECETGNNEEKKKEDAGGSVASSTKNSYKLGTIIDSRTGGKDKPPTKNAASRWDVGKPNNSGDAPDVRAKSVGKTEAAPTAKAPVFFFGPGSGFTFKAPAPIRSSATMRFGASTAAAASDRCSSKRNQDVKDVNDVQAASGKRDEQRAAVVTHNVDEQQREEIVDNHKKGSKAVGEPDATVKAASEVVTDIASNSLEENVVPDLQTAQAPKSADGGTNAESKGAEDKSNVSEVLGPEAAATVSLSVAETLESLQDVGASNLVEVSQKSDALESTVSDACSATLSKVSGASSQEVLCADVQKTVSQVEPTVSDDAVPISEETPKVEDPEVSEVAEPEAFVENKAVECPANILREESNEKDEINENVPAQDDATESTVNVKENCVGLTDGSAVKVDNSIEPLEIVESKTSSDEPNEIERVENDGSDASTTEQLPGLFEVAGKVEEPFESKPYKLEESAATVRSADSCLVTDGHMENDNSDVMFVAVAEKEIVGKKVEQIQDMPSNSEVVEPAEATRVEVQGVESVKALESEPIDGNLQGGTMPDDREGDISANSSVSTSSEPKADVSVGKGEVSTQMSTSEQVLANRESLETEPPEVDEAERKEMKNPKMVEDNNTCDISVSVLADAKVNDTEMLAVSDDVAEPVVAAVTDAVVERTPDEPPAKLTKLNVLLDESEAVSSSEVEQSSQDVPITNQIQAALLESPHEATQVADVAPPPNSANEDDFAKSVSIEPEKTAPQSAKVAESVAAAVTVPVLSSHSISKLINEVPKESDVRTADRAGASLGPLPSRVPVVEDRKGAADLLLDLSASKPQDQPVIERDIPELQPEVDPNVAPTLLDIGKPHRPADYPKDLSYLSADGEMPVLPVEMPKMPTHPMIDPYKSDAALHPGPMAYLSGVANPPIEPAYDESVEHIAEINVAKSFLMENDASNAVSGILDDSADALEEPVIIQEIGTMPSGGGFKRPKVAEDVAHIESQMRPIDEAEDVVKVRQAASALDDRTPPPDFVELECEKKRIALLGPEADDDGDRSDDMAYDDDGNVSEPMDLEESKDDGIIEQPARKSAEDALIADVGAKDEAPKKASLQSLTLDYTGEAPDLSHVHAMVRRSLKRGAADEPPKEEDDEEAGGKRRKIRGKRAVDRDLRKSVEDAKNKDVSSSDEEKKKAAAAPTPAAQSEKKPRQKRRKLLLGLEIPEEGVVVPTGLRQSRRIAQIKIKEEAERRKLEEIALDEMKAKQAKRNKKEEDKDYKAEKRKRNKIITEDETTNDTELEGKKKKKKKKKKKERTNWKAGHWGNSSSSSSSEDSHVEEEEEEEEENYVETIKSDHEFSPESDLENAADAQPLKRARTVRQEDQTQEDEVDDTSCQKCSKSDHPEWILLCDGCDAGWHCSCLRPALLVIPEGDWYCPPCQHGSLVKLLQEKLVEFDRVQSKREVELRRKQRLAYVGISLANVLPEKTDEQLRAPKERVRKPRARLSGDDSSTESSESDSGSGTGSSSESGSSSSDSDEPIYKLRQRRQAHSYRFKEYDELIKSATQEEVEVRPENDAPIRGKDMATIVQAELHENVASEAPPKVEEESDEEEIKPARKLLGKKKHRRLNSLDISSEEDEDSDEDFQGSSSDEEDDDEEYNESSSNSSIIGRKKKGRGSVRRSTRARIRRYDREFINDDSEDSDEPAGKRGRSDWEDSDESEESDRSWGRRKKRGGAKAKPAAVAPIKRKKAKKKKDLDDSDPDVYKKKKPKIKFGGLEDDDVGGGKRRTRGKKINYLDVLGTDSEEENRRRKQIVEEESEDEFVLNEEEDDVQDDEGREDGSSDDSNIGGLVPAVKKGSKKGKGKGGIKRIKRAQGEEEEALFPPLPDASSAGDAETNPIEQINKNLEAMDEKEIGMIMEDEEFANRQLQMVAAQLEKEKRRKEMEARKLEMLPQAASAPPAVPTVIQAMPVTMQPQVMPQMPPAHLHPMRAEQLQPIHHDLPRHPAMPHQMPPMHRPTAPPPQLMPPQSPQHVAHHAPPPTTTMLATTAADTPKKRGRKPKSQLTSPTAPFVPAPPSGDKSDESDLGLNADGTPKKRRGRGKGKKTLEKEAAAAAALAAAQAASSPPPPPEVKDKVERPPAERKASPTADIPLVGGKLGVASAPQPFSQAQPKPSVITRMLQSQPPCQPAYPVGGVTHNFGAGGPGGVPPRGLHPGAFRAGANHYPVIRSGAPPIRPPIVPPHVYHHPMESAGPPMPERSSPALTSPSSASPLSNKSDPTPPPPPAYAVRPPMLRFPPAAAAPPPPRHPLLPQMHQARPAYTAAPPHGYHYAPQYAEAGAGAPYQHAPPHYQEQQFAGDSDASKNYEEEENGEFGGLVSYFSSQREDDLDT